MALKLGAVECHAAVAVFEVILLKYTPDGGEYRTVVVEANSEQQATSMVALEEDEYWCCTNCLEDLGGYGAEEYWEGFDHSLLEPGSGAYYVPDAPAYVLSKDHDAHVYAWEFATGVYDMPF